MSVPAFAPARGGAFAGGNQRVPSAAPPGTMPGTMQSPFAANARPPTAPGGPNPYAAQAQSAPGVPNPYAGQAPSGPTGYAGPAGSLPGVPNPYTAQSHSAPGVPNPYAAQSQSAPGVPNPYGAQAQSAPGTMVGVSPFAQPGGLANPYAAQNTPGTNPFASPFGVPGKFGGSPAAPSGTLAGQMPAILPPMPPSAAPPATPMPPPNGAPWGPPTPAPMPFAPPQGTPTPPPVNAALAPTRKPSSSKKGLVIAIVLVLLAGGAVAAVLMLRGGGAAKTGIDSRDDLAKRTLEAFSTRDVEGLLALAGPADVMHDFADCKPSDKPDDDPAKQREALRKGYKQLVDDAKGLNVELVEIVKDSKTTLEKGKEIANCTLTKPLDSVTVTAKVKVTYKNKRSTLETTMVFTEVDERWYLAMPPALHPPVDCETAAAQGVKASADVLAKLQLSDAALAKLEKALTDRCTDDKWPPDVTDCVAKSQTDADTDACVKKLPTAARDRLKKALEQIVDAEKKAHVADKPAAPPPPVNAGSNTDPLPPEEPGGSPDELPKSCAEWKDELARLEKCKSLPKATRKQLSETFALVEQRWKDLSTKTSAMRTSFEGTCRSALESVLELRKSCR